MASFPSKSKNKSHNLVSESCKVTSDDDDKRHFSAKMKRNTFEAKVVFQKHLVSPFQGFYGFSKFWPKIEAERGDQSLLWKLNVYCCSKTSTKGCRCIFQFSFSSFKGDIKNLASHRQSKQKTVRYRNGRERERERDRQRETDRERQSACVSEKESERAHCWRAHCCRENKRIFYVITSNTIKAL